jgi:Zn-finger nucleic acid-binding protein
MTDDLLLDATGAPCPACGDPLGPPRSETEAVHPCKKCHGAFVELSTLAELVAREDDHARKSPWAPGLPNKRPARSSREIRCPVCNDTMAVMNFGSGSGVIVDTCREHGTFFDKGELAGVLEFVRLGGFRAGPSADLAKNERLAPRGKEKIKEAMKVEDEDIDAIDTLFDVIANTSIPPKAG